MKRNISQAEIKANLELLTDTTIKEQTPAFNVIHINSPMGKKIIKTELSLEQFLALNQLKPKVKKQCRRK
jgi:hypothetical protein